MSDLTNPNVRKFLDFLGKSEGADYNTIVGGGQFSDFSKHPATVGLTTKEGPSTAAGSIRSPSVPTIPSLPRWA
jgi:muramidase (phage lysozyme)